MATDHAEVVLVEREGSARESGCTVRGSTAGAPVSELHVKADATNSRKSAHLLRGGVSVITLAAFVVLVLGKRTALTRSLGRIGHPQWSWIAMGIALEVSSMTTFAPL